jgi:serine/threonine-protein kinase RsbW
MEEQLFDIHIASRLEFLGVLAKLVEGLQVALDLTDEETFALSTSLIEAGTNAIQHGASPEGPPVRVVMRRDGDRLVLDVRDHGRGFDLKNVEPTVSAATTPDHLFDSRGRGIFIMRSLMDEVNFSRANDNGTQVTLVLRRKANGR